MLIRSWVTCYNVPHWLPLKMRTRPLHMCQDTWPMSRLETITFFGILDPDLPVHCTLYNFYSAMTTITGRLLSSHPMFGKPFLAKISKSRWNGGQKWQFRENMGLNLRYGFCDPQKALPCAEPHLLTYFASKSVCTSCGSLSREPPPPWVTLSRGARNHTFAEMKPLNRFG